MNTTQTRATVRNAVLAALKAAFPAAVGPDELHAIAGRPYPSRIGELREAGWRIDPIYDGIDPRPSYFLTSLDKGEPDPATWGLRARLGPTSGLVVSEYGTGSVRLPEAAWARVRARVEAVLNEELAAAGVQILNAEPEPEPDWPDWLDVLAALGDDDDGDPQ